MLSPYLQVQIFIVLYSFAIGTLGYASFTLLEFCCARPQGYPLPPIRQIEPQWIQAGWYYVTPKESVPLYHNLQMASWAYSHKGSLVFPTDAAVNRRGILV